MEYRSKSIDFTSTTPDQVEIILALYRVESKGVDLVLTANLPVSTEAGDGLNSEQIHEAKEAFLTASRSLKILDFGLFV